MHSKKIAFDTNIILIRSSVAIIDCLIAGNVVEIELIGTCVFRRLGDKSYKAATDGRPL